MAGKSYLPTEAGTQLEWSTSRPWCAGHRWASRNRALGWAHRLGHRARLLRVKPLARPLVYITDAKAVDPDPRVFGRDRPACHCGHPWCLYCHPAADPEAEFALLVVLGAMLADVLTHPAGMAALEAEAEAEARRWHGNLRDRRSEDP